jgi:hypothetical protein
MQRRCERLAMMAEIGGSVMTSQMDDIFGEPALLESEDKQHYQRLFAAIEADIQPKSFFDRMQVREQTDKIWEELRYKRSSAALIDSVKIDALESLLDPIYRQRISLMSAHKAALAYYGGDAKAKKDVVAVMKQYGITETIIQAKAMQMTGGTLQLLDRMIINRENARRSLRREHELRAPAKDGPRLVDLEKSA